MKFDEVASKKFSEIAQGEIFIFKSDLVFPRGVYIHQKLSSSILSIEVKSQSGLKQSVNAISIQSGVFLSVRDDEEVIRVIGEEG